jgi:hypothetical protein
MEKADKTAIYLMFRILLKGIIMLVSSAPAIYGMIDFNKEILDVDEKLVEWRNK